MKRDRRKHDKKRRSGRKGMPDRKKKILIAAAAVIVLAAGIGTAVYINISASGDDTAGNASVSLDGADAEAQDGSGAGGTDGQEKQSGQEEENGEDVQGEDGTVQEGFMPGGVGSLNVVPDVVINLDEEPEEETAESVELPYAISGTELTVDKITSYDGIFIEDGSDEEISGVTAMVLTNKGDTDVEYAEVTAQQSDQTLLFKASAVPAGATVVVLEANRAGWSDESVTQIYASATDGSDFEMSEDLIQIEDNGDDSITVTNTSDEAIPCVRLFYKYKMEEDIYVGGIAYAAKLTDLGEGESQTVRPSHYVSGSSEVVMARTYETAD